MRCAQKLPWIWIVGTFPTVMEQSKQNFGGSMVAQWIRSAVLMTSGSPHVKTAVAMAMASPLLLASPVSHPFHGCLTKFLSAHPPGLPLLKSLNGSSKNARPQEKEKKARGHRHPPGSDISSFVPRASASSDGSSSPLPSIVEQRQPAELVEQRMKELAESMVLPPTFLAQLPNDLKSDLKDAAFSLSNGPVQRECGELAGEKLVQLSRAWEKGDAQAAALAADELQFVLPEEMIARSAIGKRLIDAGRRFASMGSYEKGELQKIAKALTGAGEILYVSDASRIDEELQPTVRTYKFGDLQVELTAQKCYIGCFIALAFGTISWGLTNSLQNVPESSLQFANDNATLLATSLRGALLLLGFSSTFLSGLIMAGLLGLSIELSSKTDASN